MGCPTAGFQSFTGCPRENVVKSTHSVASGLCKQKPTTKQNLQTENLLF